MKQELGHIVIIKVGTSTLTRKGAEGQIELDTSSFTRIGAQVSALQTQGYGVIIVSSAAITAGMVVTKTMERPVQQEATMPTLQALASIGWRHVLNCWDDALKDSIVGELLITKQELGRDSERSELMNVIKVLLERGYVPIVNENDAITHEEIAYGDNDTLAAHLAVKLKVSSLFCDAISVVLLSDIDGVYEDSKDQRTLMKQIKRVADYKHVISGVKSEGGTGGMTTKFSAAEIAQQAGVDLYIANGRAQEAVIKAITGEIGTHFTSK